jgi:hypothetical protein
MMDGNKVSSSIMRICQVRILLIYLLSWPAAFVFNDPALAEYGDVVINNYSDAQNIRPVVFPHWFHRIRFACKVCHTE